MSDINHKEAACFHLNFSVRYGEIGENGVATLSALGNWLQEAAGRNADELGFGEHALLPYGVTWILTRLVLRISRLPRAGESLQVYTWPSRLDRFGHRGYEIYDGTGRLIVSGGSAWTVMKLEDRSMTALPDQLKAVYPSSPRPCDEFSCRVIPRIRTDAPRSSCMLRVRRDDLDINGHVNNTRYLAWLMEAFQPFPAFHGKKAPSVPKLLDISFRSETFPHEELECVCSATTVHAEGPVEIMGIPVPYAYLHSIRRSCGEEACRALTLWDTPPEGTCTMG